MYDTILFVDFDGTITSEETLEGSMRLCIDPVLYTQKEKEMLNGKATLAQTLHLAFSEIPSHRLGDIMEYVRGISIRPGFDALLERMEALQIPVVVISGGLQPYVEEKLSPYRSRLLAIHSVAVDQTGPALRLVSGYEEKGEIMQKTLVMREYDYRHAICIGDSYTDVGMAKASQTVFARDMLLRILQKEGVPCTPWKDFYDVMDCISSSK